MVDTIDNKTFSIRFFLNERLKPLKDEKGSLAYPVYLQVNYNRKNAQFPLDLSALQNAHSYKHGFREANSSFSYFNPEFFSQVLDVYDHKGGGPPEAHYYSHILERAASRLKEIVVFEKSKLKKNFSLKGLGNRFAFFNSNIVDKLDRYLVDQLKKELSGEVLSEDGGTLENADSLISYSMTFYQNYDALTPYNISLPKSLETDIEAFFIIAAFAETRINTNDIFNWVFKDEAGHFERFLSNSPIFDSSKELRLPLSNFFVRYVSLNPPSYPSNFYVQYTENFIQSQLEKTYQ